MSISITPLHPLFAARVSGIDLSQPVDPDDFVRSRQRWISTPFWCSTDRR